VDKRLKEPTVEFSMLIEILRSRALQQPEQRAYTFLIDGEVEGLRLTYGQLDCQARAIAAKLQQNKAQGERALLLYPPGLEFIVAFCGCLYAGVIAIPAPPPDAARLKRTLPRLQAIAKDAQASLVLTTSRILSMVEDAPEQVGEFQGISWLITEQVNSELAEEWQDPIVKSDTLAYLQYTSGSTSTPKGVMVSHGNLMDHCAKLSQAWDYTSDSIAATWMPYFHDYGLVDGLLQPLYTGIPCYVMSPLTFIKRPLRWLQTISRYKVTHSQGPNFAYEHCVRRTSPEQYSNLDLSTWRIASNGAEPIRKETLERFVEAFKPFGFRACAFYPAYGLAEATLLVSTKPKTDMPVFCTVSAAALQQNQIIEASEYQHGVQTLVGCGHPIGDTKVVIVHPQTLNQCEPNQVGEIWISSRSVAQGYWNRPQETASTFRAYLASTGVSEALVPSGASAAQSLGPFLRTGDLGFLHDGELFVTGRLKDLIIIRGRNHYPQDIEFTVEKSHPALRLSCGAAFSVDVAAQERLVVVQEVERHYQTLDFEQVVGAVRQAIALEHELEVYAVLLLKTGSILKTSSGKIKRQACRVSFLDGSLDIVGTWTSNKAAEEDRRNTESSLHPCTEKAPLPLFDVAAQDKSRERASDLINWLRSYATDRINSQLIDQRRCIPPYVVLDFGNRGILGMQVPEQYGGIALNNRDTMRVIEQLAGIDLTLATFVCINNFLGIRPLQRYATKAVRDELLPILAKGRELIAFALTEPGAGSNPRAICATGVPDDKGGWQLSGHKIWSGSASWAGLINVFVQLVDANKSSGITGFVVRQGTAGLHQGPESLTMGMRGVVQNSIYLDNVPVAAVNLLGEVGAGMEAAQDAMLFTRLAIGAMSVGGMKRCTQLMLRYATRRDIATGCLLDNPVTLARLSDLTAAITTLETLVTRIAELLDNGCFVPVEAYVACKTSGPEFLWKAADSLVQLLGGRGYIETNIAPQILRDARVFRIFEGPTETLNMFLGSRVLHQSSELKQFLANGLGAPEVWDILSDATQQIQARWSKSTAPSRDRSSALHFAHMLIGEVATYAILLAAVQGVVNRIPSSRLRRAVDWAQQQFEQTLAKALSGTPVESVLQSADETTDLISSYAEAIGDLEQTLAGEDNALDELLRHRREHSTPAPPAPPASPTIFSPPAPPDLFADHTTASIEAWLAKWLANELGIKLDVIDTSKYFVHYGLDSVTAITLIADLEVWLERQLPLTLAWDYPSIQKMAQHLVLKSNVVLPSPWSSLVAIQPSGSKLPFFCVHAAYSSVFMYYNLASHLAPEQPVYGLQPQGLDEKQVPHTRIEDMAAEYIREIRTVQPQGPYFLGGFSLGGKVAFEMAQQLHFLGEKVAMVALFDTQGPEWLKPLPVNARVSRHLANLLRLKPKEKLAYVQKKLTRRYDSAQIQPLPQVQHKSLLQQAHEQADRDYIAQVYPGRVILFRASEQPVEWLEEWLQWWGIDPKLGWGSLVTGGLDLYEVPGHHMNMFKEPYIQVLAEKLQACLDQVQANVYSHHS